MPTEQIDVSKLSRVLGLLGSDQAGEVLAAARAAHRIVAESGLTWAEVLKAPPEPTYLGNHTIDTPSGELIRPPCGSRTWLDALRVLCAARAGGNQRENQFLDDLCALQAHHPNRPVLSWKQARWIVDIHAAWCRREPVR